MECTASLQSKERKKSNRLTSRKFTEAANQLAISWDLLYRSFACVQCESLDDSLKKKKKKKVTATFVHGGCLIIIEWYDCRA